LKGFLEFFGFFLVFLFVLIYIYSGGPGPAQLTGPDPAELGCVGPILAQQILFSFWGRAQTSPAIRAGPELNRPKTGG